MITILFSKKHNDNSNKLSMKLNSEKVWIFFLQKEYKNQRNFFF